MPSRRYQCAAAHQVMCVDVRIQMWWDVEPPITDCGHCGASQVNSIAGQGLQKLYLMEGLQKARVS